MIKHSHQERLNYHHLNIFHLVGKKQMKDLSIIIPSNSEIFLSKTIEDILEHIEADTEIIAVLDGRWAKPAIPQNDRVNIIYVPKSIGQRASTNIGVKLSRAKYVMK